MDDVDARMPEYLFSYASQSSIKAFAPTGRPRPTNKWTRYAWGCSLEHTTQDYNMKKLFIPSAIALSAMLLLTGCLALQVGGGDKKEMAKPSTGQQLVDLKTARDTGAITDAEYETQKAKLLNAK